MSAAWRWLWRGDLPADAIAIRYDGGSAPRGEALAAAIAADWSARLAAPGAPVLTDDPVAPLLGFEAGVGELRLSLGRSSYAHWLFAAGRQAERERDFGAAGPCRPLALCAALIAPGGELVLTRRSGRVAEGAGLLHVVGGHLDPTRHLLAARPHPTVAMRCELEEELGLTGSDLADGRLLGLVEHPASGKPELLYRWRLRLGETELRERAARAVDRFEADALHLVPPSGWAELSRSPELALPSRALLARLGV